MKKRWIWLFVWAFILFIWGNSLTIGETSGQMSGNVTRILLSFVNKAGFSIDFELFHHYVRKLAHFSEYAALGCLTSLAIYLSPLSEHHARDLIIYWIAIPSIDETIQHFVPDRYGCIPDVLLDMSGYLFGALFFYIISCIVKDIQARRSR